MGINTGGNTNYNIIIKARFDQKTLIPDLQQQLNEINDKLEITVKANFNTKDFGRSAETASREASKKIRDTFDNFKSIKFTPSMTPVTSSDIEKYIENIKKQIGKGKKINFNTALTPEGDVKSADITYWTKYGTQIKERLGWKFDEISQSKVFKTIDVYMQQNSATMERTRLKEKESLERNTKALQLYRHEVEKLSSGISKVPESQRAGLVQSQQQLLESITTQKPSKFNTNQSINLREQIFQEKQKIKLLTDEKVIAEQIDKVYVQQLKTLDRVHNSMKSKIQTLTDVETKTGIEDGTQKKVIENYMTQQMAKAKTNLDSIISNSKQQNAVPIFGIDYDRQIKQVERDFEKLTKTYKNYINNIKDGNSTQEENTKIANTWIRQLKQLSESNFGRNAIANPKSKKEIDDLVNSQIAKVEQLKQSREKLKIEELEAGREEIRMLKLKRQALLELEKQSDKNFNFQQFPKLTNSTALNVGNGAYADVNLLESKELRKQLFNDIREQGFIRDKNFASAKAQLTAEIREQQILHATNQATLKGYKLINTEIERRNNYIKVTQSMQKGNEIVDVVNYINKATGAVHNQSTGIRDLTHDVITWDKAMVTAIKRMVQWTVSGALLFGTMRLFKDAVQYVMEFDNALTELRKVTSFTEGEFNKLSDSAVRLGTELGKSSVDVMKGMAEFGRYFKTVADITEMTRVAIMASNISTLSVQEASKALTSTMVAFKLGVQDASIVLDQFNELQNNFRISAEDIAGAIGTMGASAKQAGISIQDLEGYVVAMTTATNISGDEAGTAYIFVQMVA